MQYSGFGFFPRQTSARRVIFPMIFIRLLCGIVVFCIVQTGDCSLNSGYFCKCILLSLEPGPEMWDEGWEVQERGWSCDRSPVLYQYNKEMVEKPNTPLDRNPSARIILQSGKAGHLCDGERLFEPDFGQYRRFFMIPNSSRWCDLDSSMPAMLATSCWTNEIDPLQFQLCLYSVPEVFRSVCTGRSLVCAVLAGQKLLLFTYVFLPTAALLALLLMHAVAELLSKSLAGVEENKALRKAIQTKSKQYQEQLHAGILDHSLWWLGIRHSKFTSCYKGFVLLPAM